MIRLIGTVRHQKRNKGERGLTREEVTGQVLNFIKGKEVRASSSTIQTVQRWCAPPPGTLNINCYGAFIHDTFNGG